MKLAGFELYRYGLPLTAPQTLKGATFHHREGLLLRLAGEDGCVGWGETAPLPGFSDEGLDTAAAGLRELAETVVGREATDEWVDPAGRFSRGLDQLNPTPSVRFGFELALWNLYAASSGRMLPGLVARQPRAAVPVNGLLFGSPVEILGEARRMKDVGYRTVKLKVGGWSLDRDVGLVRALGEILGDAVSLRLDANRAWGFEEALVGMELEALGGHRYARAVVLKPTLLGGISRTLRVSERVLCLGMTPVVSSAYESGVGTAALVALAAGIGESAVPAGLDTYRRLAADVLVSPLDLAVPSVRVREVAD